MKICVISDTHCLHDHLPELPNADVLIHCGDFCGYGSRIEAQRFNEWLGKQPHSHKIVICGNHDRFAEKYPVEVVREKLSNAIYLHGEYVEIDGVKFWGGPWTPEFCNWAFNVPRGELKPYWDRIHPETDVLITHGPPYGILDYVVYSEEHVGDKELLERIGELQYLKLHCFGHIHGSYGIREGFKVKYVNASVCNEEYRVVNKPIVVEI